VRVGASNTSERRSAVASGHPTVRHAVESILLEERTRWAMQIHDGLTQSVTSAVLELQTLRHLIETDPDAATRILHEIETEIRADLRHIRELLFEMTEEEVISSDATLAALIKDFAARWRMPVTVRVEGDIEALNDAKHSGAPGAVVALTIDADRLHIEVQDRGRGMVAVTNEDPHFGIRIMRARAESIGGTLEMTSTPGHGTTVVAELPVVRAGEGR
jgi:two-component system, NarL family, nitrate/nitrite sensor histidine kinase NarX